MCRISLGNWEKVAVIINVSIRNVEKSSAWYIFQTEVQLLPIPILRQIFWVSMTHVARLVFAFQGEKHVGQKCMLSKFENYLPWARTTKTSLLHDNDSNNNFAQKYGLSHFSRVAKYSNQHNIDNECLLQTQTFPCCYFSKLLVHWLE